MEDIKRGMTPAERIKLLIKHETNPEKLKQLNALLDQLNGMDVSHQRQTLTPKRVNL